MQKKFLLLALALILTAFQANAQSSKYPDLDIPHKKIVLGNGLTVIVHEDHKVPIVAVNVWYHVGSKNEKRGKTGFAHLFEHLMFNGSENHNTDWFIAMETIGATNLNGTTNNDRTNYFQNVPLGAFDHILFLESDRMGHLLGAIDQPRLDEQRGVVQNEKRQGENEPYAIAEDLVIKATFPEGHPYSWSVIGSMEDLNAASIADVHEWFKTYYGAANAVIVIAGDINTDEAIEKVKKYFGDIPAGPPVAHFNRWVPKMTGVIRQEAQDRVPQTQLNMVWNVPGTGDKESEMLDVAADVLGGGKTSRLYKRLVYKEQLCSSISVYNASNEICGQFYITGQLKPGVDEKKVEAIIYEELNKFLASGATAEELEITKNRRYANEVKGMERIGGFGGKSDILAQSQVYMKDANAWKTTLNNYLNAQNPEIIAAAKKWLSDGTFILTIKPFPTYAEAKTGVDRKKIPEVQTVSKVNAPKFEKTTLSNGAKLVVAERRGLPIVNISMMVRGGTAADIDAMPGVASLTANMLDEGTKTMEALAISDKLTSIGTSLSSSASLDFCNLNMNTLTNKLDEALGIFSDVLINPSFPEKEFTRLKKQQIIGIANEKNSPQSMAMRVMPLYLFPEGHPYRNPLTGSGTEKSVEKITLEDLKKYYAKYYIPNNATIVVTGDISLAEAKAKLEKALASWKKGTVAQVKSKDCPLYFDNVLYVMDRPGSPQSLIFAGHLLPKKNDVDEYSLSVMNDILGGDFTSRLNMNLREDKHWSYGVGAFPYGTQSQRPFMVFAPVQTDKTKESIMELKKEISQYIGEKPVTEAEVVKAKKNNQAQLNGSWETNGGISGYIGEIVRYNQPDDYLEKMYENLGKVSQSSVAKVAKDNLNPEKMVWVVVGDKDKIAAGLKELNFSKIIYVDTDGNEVK